MSKNDLEGKNILVTGAGGFIGSHLTEHLVRCGAKVRAFHHYNALGRRGWLEDSELAGEIEFVAGDIADPHSVKSAMSGCDTCMHLAALIAIPYSYVAPESYVRTNVVGTLNVLQAARESGARVVHTSTSEVYGTAQFVPITEEHPLQGQSPYSASKIGADKLAESFYRSFELPVVTIRPFNTFGPRQSARAVIPTIISQCVVGDRIKLGATTPTRDLNFVANTARGFAMAATSDAVVGETVNLGSGEEISIGDLAVKIGELMGKQIEIECEQERLRPEKSEVNRLLGDNRKARETLGWTPEISFEDGLRETIAWFEGHLHHYRPGDYTV